MRVSLTVAAFALLLTWRPAPCAAQLLPSGPITGIGGRLTFSADGSISYGSDDPGYFNYSSYDTSLTRQIRIDGVVSFRVNDYLSLLADIRLIGPIGQGSWSFGPYALFARVRPWTGHHIDVQAGLIPPVFGAFSRRAYGTDNPLIGYPLAYQYLTSLRSDTPLSANELVAMRGLGWTSYGSGQYGTAGVPLIDGLIYPAGVEVRVGSRPIEVSGAVTTGSLSVPRPTGSNIGSQLSARVAVIPTTGLVLGASVSRGHYLYATDVDYGSSDTQGAIGFDVEYSRAHWILRTEGLLTRWQLPYLANPFNGYPTTRGPISAFGIDAEARYRIRPGFYAAARAGMLNFSEVTTAYGISPWEAPVRRVEAGVGYSIARNMTMKAAYQWNWRDTVDLRTAGLALVQLHIGF